MNEATGATGFKAALLLPAPDPPPGPSCPPQPPAQPQGNPTECALLSLVAEMGYDYAALRHDTPGRSLATAARGKPPLP